MMTCYVGVLFVLLSVEDICRFELSIVFFFQAEDGIRDLVRFRGLGDVYKRQRREFLESPIYRELILGDDGQETALQVTLKPDLEWDALLERREILRSKRGQGFFLSLIHISEPTRPY